MQCAANKEIAKATQHLHPASSLEEKGLCQCEDLNRTSISSFSRDTGRGLFYIGVRTSEQELASTRQELADCKLMVWPVIAFLTSVFCLEIT